MTKKTKPDRIVSGFERVLRKHNIRPSALLLGRMVTAELQLAGRGLDHGPSACLDQVRATNAARLMEEFELYSVLRDSNHHRPGKRRKT